MMLCTILAIADIIEEADSELHSNWKEKRASVDLRKELMLSLQTLGDYGSLLVPPPCITSAANPAASKAAMFVSGINALHQCLDSNDLDHIEGAMDAIYKICEDVPEEIDVDVLDLSERPINVFLPRLLQFFQYTHAILRKLALGCINQYIVVMPTVVGV
ncbi:hypothetical protein GUJ93_ZPchr0012g20228 [Zizania palustris]|uniref:Uncharacterized protein n=1 Tax=Zizania palustris TaxID=103762 RepID=A0A8J6BX01_ZIZPA|nr:hypothetical protein GUJ93_ZPchr0012g20228 [Zizania palustris]